MVRTHTGFIVLVGIILVVASGKMAFSYTLTVESGTGDGSYAGGTPVSITADAAPSGYAFNMWIGDPDGFADWDACKASSSTYTMPDHDQTLTATYRPTSSPTDWWGYFDIFCKETFGAEKEILAYDIFGNTLEFMSETGSEWSHVSETSACIAFETNLPAKTYIEYGETVAYGSETPASDRYYYLHIYHLRDLDPDTTYHYRFVAEDERGNVIYSPEKTFTTATPADVVYVPAGVSGPPYNLNQSGKTYLVTEDLVCNRTGFNINNNNITLDLDGHTVTYNQEDYQVTSNYRDTSSMGVRAVGRSNIKVVNGVIKQGLGYNTADTSSIGYSPAHLESCSGELSGVSIDYAGTQVSGFRLDYSSSLVAHHNVILDRGGDVDDRHTSPKAIRAAGDCHHNLIKRHRQIAFSAGHNSDYYNNEFYVDSCATNGAGIMFYKSTNSSAYGNRIFGTGYLVIGISTVSSGIADVMVHDNFIHLQATRPDTRWPEYGPQSGAYCCRITWGGDNLQYYDNIMATYGRDEGMVRGTWFSASPSIVDCVFDSNVLEAVLQTLDSDIQGCIVHVGDGDPGDAPIVYSNNRLISNFCNARMGEDYYHCGCNAEFYDNTFVKVGPDRPGDYRTIGVGYGSYRSSGHKFFDSSFEGGASYDEVRFDGWGTRNFYVGWTLTVQTEPLANITIRDAFNSLVYSDQADGSGLAEAKLYQYFEEPSGRTYHTPHDVLVELGGDTNGESVTMDSKKTIDIWVISYPLTVTNGSGDGLYGVGEVVPISADPPASGKEFAMWIGDVAYVDDTSSASTTVTMPAAAISVTATYRFVYPLTVNSGSGSGEYPATTVVNIDADAPPFGLVFDEWTGDTDYVDDPDASSTTVTMPPGTVEVTATYHLRGDLNADGFVGQTDLDIVLDQWGHSGGEITDPRADPNNDDFVGQTDLDIVLDDWGQSSGP